MRDQFVSDTLPGWLSEDGVPPIAHAGSAGLSLLPRLSSSAGQGAVRAADAGLDRPASCRGDAGRAGASFQSKSVTGLVCCSPKVLLA